MCQFSILFFQTTLFTCIIFAADSLILPDQALNKNSEIVGYHDWPDSLVETGDIRNHETILTRRVKRSMSQLSDEDYDKLYDEDYRDTIKKEKGNPGILQKMQEYMDFKISQITAIGEKMMPRKKYNVFKLVTLCSEIMAVNLNQHYPLKSPESIIEDRDKTCSPLNLDFLDIAENSYLAYVVDKKTVAEPYIPHAVFQRIEEALIRCLQRASPHNFLDSTMEPLKPDASEDEKRLYKQMLAAAAEKRLICDNSPSKSASEFLQNGDQQESLKIDDFAINYNLTDETFKELQGVYDPIIETVWQSFVNAHSYCFSDFSEHYNDHHAFTVAILPLFSLRQFAEIWTDVHTITEREILYGGLFQNETILLQTIDRCVAASRLNSKYPWYMARPI